MDNNYLIINNFYFYFYFKVAAGFDASKDDLLGGCKVSPGCFAHMTHMLKALSGGKLALILEVFT